MKINRSRTLLIAIVTSIILVSSATARTKTSLNNGWRFHKADVSDASSASYNDVGWQRVNLPHTWNVDDPWDDTPVYYRGPGWYRRDLVIPAATRRGNRFFLYFEAANQIADVYVNGQKAGSHIGGYSAFAFDITDHVKTGRNIIAVRVDNSFNEDIPPLTADFNFYGGIYRDVWLITTNQTHITVTDHASPGVKITTPDIAGGKGTVSIEGIVVNASSNTTVATTILDASRRSVATGISRTGDDGRFSTAIEVRNPKLWSPDSANLYSVKISVRNGGRVVDEITQPLGFRWFNFDAAKGFFLNGKHLKLRGTNRHQDYKGLGNALPNNLHLRDMQIIKDTGFNFVRLAHYPQDPAVLEACDRLGLLVWEETPLVNYITNSSAFADNSELMVREMVRQHRNHPSMLLWGYMNEIFLRNPNNQDLHKPTVDLARRLNSIVKEEDPTRPTTIAFHGNDVYNRTGLGEVPDVIGWNLYQGWYSQTVTDFGKFMDEQHARFPNRPLILSEYGANGDRRLHSSEPRRFDSTIDYQRFFHESYLSQIDARPYIAGTAIWNEFDFGAEQRGETIPHLNQKGMYTFDRRPKDIHYFYKASLSKKPVVHIAVRDNQRRAGPKGEKHRIDVYSNLPSIELYHNGKSIGRKPVDSTHKVSWDVEFIPGTNPLVAHAPRGRHGVTDSIIVTFTEVTVRSPEIAINVGSNADFTDANGTIWIADQPYQAGSWGFLGTNAKRTYSQPPDPNILGTDSDPLFQTNVEGLSEYKIDVPSGSHTVELLFAERVLTEAGKRRFHVDINGKRVISRIDLVTEAGRNRAVTKQFQIDTSGGLSIKFDRIEGQPILNGVRIRRGR